MNSFNDFDPRLEAEHFNRRFEFERFDRNRFERFDPCCRRCNFCDCFTRLLWGFCPFRCFNRCNRIW